MSAALRYTPEFCDSLIRRLRAGEEPAQLRQTLNVGAAAMRRFECFARHRAEVA